MTDARRGSIGVAPSVQAGLVFLLVAVLSVLALPGPSRVLAEGLYADDAFYYFEIASNVLRGGGLTFDTINLTNGFQPLWLIVLLPLAVLGLDGDVYVAAVWWLQVLLAALSVALAYVLVRRTGPHAHVWIVTALLLGSLPLMPLWNGGMINGLETPVFALLLILALLLLQRYLTCPSIGVAWALGATLALVLLARLDGLLLVLLVGALLLIKGVGSWAGRFVVVGVPAVVALTYFAWNAIAFGSLSPVSGATKSIWGRAALDAAVAAGGQEWRLRLANIAWPKQYLGPVLDRLGQTGQGGLLVDAAVVLIVLLAYAAITVFYWRRGMPVLAVLQAFLLGKFIVYGYLQYGFANYSWYWMLDILGLVIFVAVAVETLLEEPQTQARIAALVVAGAFAAAAVAGNVLVERGRAWLAPDPTTGEIAEYAGSKYAAETLNGSLPPNTLMASSDAGILGFYLDAPLVNTDGLVNGRERLEFTREHGQAQLPYLLAHPEFDGFVNWVVTANSDNVADTMQRAGFAEVPGFAACANKVHGSVSNDRGQLRLYLRPDQAAAWSCPA